MFSMSEPGDGRQKVRGKGKSGKRSAFSFTLFPLYYGFQATLTTHLFWT